MIKFNYLTAFHTSFDGDDKTNEAFDEFVKESFHHDNQYFIYGRDIISQFEPSVQKEKLMKISSKYDCMIVVMKFTVSDVLTKNVSPCKKTCVYHGEIEGKAETPWQVMICDWDKDEIGLRIYNNSQTRFNYLTLVSGDNQEAMDDFIADFNGKSVTVPDQKELKGYRFVLSEAKPNRGTFNKMSKENKCSMEMMIFCLAECFEYSSLGRIFTVENGMVNEVGRPIDLILGHRNHDAILKQL